MNFNQSSENGSTINKIGLSKLSKVSPNLNIDKLILRYRKEKAKEKTETLIFVGLACALVVISGIIVSL